MFCSPLLTSLVFSRRSFSTSFPPPPVPPQWRKHDSDSPLDTPYDPSQPRITVAERTAKAKSRYIQLKDCVISYYLLLDQARKDIYDHKQYLSSFLNPEYRFNFPDNVLDHFGILLEVESRISTIESEERQRRARLSSADFELTKLFERDAKVAAEAILQEMEIRPWLFPVRKPHYRQRVGKSEFSVVLSAYWDFYIPPDMDGLFFSNTKLRGHDYLNTFYVTPFRYLWDRMVFYHFSDGGRHGVKMDSYNIGAAGFNRELFNFVLSFPQLDLIYQHRSLLPYFARWRRYLYQIYIRRWCEFYIDLYLRPDFDWNAPWETDEIPRMDWKEYESLEPRERSWRNFLVHVRSAGRMGHDYLVLFTFYIFYLLAFFLLDSFALFYAVLSRLSLFYLGWAGAYQKPRLFFLNRLIDDRRQNNNHLLRLEPYFNYDSQPNATKFDLWIWDRIDAEYSLNYDERLSTYLFNPAHERFYYENYPVQETRGLLGHLFYLWSFKDLSSPFISRRLLKQEAVDPLSHFLRTPLRRFERWLDMQDWVNYVTVLYRSQALTDYNTEVEFWLEYDEGSSDLREWLYYRWGTFEEWEQEEDELDQLDLFAVFVAYFAYFFMIIFHLVFGPIFIFFSYVESRLGLLHYFVASMTAGLYFIVTLSPLAPYYFFWARVYPIYWNRSSRLGGWFQAWVSWFQKRYGNFFGPMPPPLTFTGRFFRLVNFLFIRPLEYVFRFFFFFFVYTAVAPLALIFGKEMRDTFYQLFSLTRTYKSPGMKLTGYAPGGELLSDHKGLGALSPGEESMSIDHHGPDSTPFREKGFPVNPQDYFSDDNSQRFFMEFSSYPYSDPTYTTRDGYDDYAKFSYWNVFGYRFPRSRFYFLSDAQYEKNFNAVPRFSTSFLGNIIYRFRARRQFFDFLYAPRKFLKPNNIFGSWVLGVLLLLFNVFRLYVFRPVFYLCFNFLYYLFVPALFAYCLSCIDLATVWHLTFQLIVPMWPGDTINHITANHVRVLFVVNALWLFVPPFRHLFGDTTRLTWFNALLCMQWFLINQDPAFTPIFFNQFEQIRGGVRRNNHILWWGLWPFKEFPPPQGDEPTGVGFIPAL